MIRQNQRLLNIFNGILEALLLVGAYFLARVLWMQLFWGGARNDLVFARGTIYASVLYALIMVGIYYAFHLYGSFRYKNIWREIFSIAEANALGVMGISAVLYFLQLQEFSRGIVFSFYVLSTVIIVAKRACQRWALRYYRKKGFNQKHVLLVGSGHLAHQYFDSVRKNPQFGFVVHGYISDTPADGLGERLGGYADLEKLVSGSDYDEVVVALEAADADRMQKVLAGCEKQGTRVSIIPFYSEYIPSRPTVDVIGDAKLINVRSMPLDNLFNAFLKRTMDIVGSLLLIVLTSPLMLFAAVGTRLSSPGPIIFKQERVGLNKKPFTMYKFRSMRINAAQNTAWSQNTDPRKTKFGSILRKTSIDELPQFFNVLKGDMSLIGPRPEIPHFVEQFRETVPLYMVKHQVRPGITGWAQVNGYRGDTSIEERIKCDIWYIENWSLGLDIRILFRTVFGGMVNKEKVTQ